MITVNEIYEYINELAPFNTAESWDNSGIIVNTGKSAEKVLVALDITEDTVLQAAELGCKAIISHHPVIFSPVKSISFENTVYKLIENGISAVCAHTNVDAAECGVNAVLCEKLGLLNKRPFLPLGYIGELDEEQNIAQFAKHCAKALGSPVRLSDARETVKNVAVIGGSGADFINEAKSAGADCLLTGDVGHHDALDARAIGLSLIAAGHFETESPIIAHLTDLLKAKFPDTEFVVSTQQSPFKTIL